MGYVSSETRSNYAAAEALIEDTYETLTNHDVVQALGDYATVLLSYTENLYLPNVRNNEIIYPTNSEVALGTPIVIAEPDNTYRVDPLYYGIHPRVRERSKMYLNNKYRLSDDFEFEGLFEKAEGHLLSTHEQVSLSLESTSSATVSYKIDTFKATVGKKKLIVPYTTRPILMVQPEAAKKRNAGIMSIHELVHIDQTYRRSLSAAFWRERRFDLEDLEREIEAYTYESVATSALYPDISPYTRMHMTQSFGPLIDDIPKKRSMKRPDHLISAFQAHRDRLSSTFEPSE